MFPTAQGAETPRSPDVLHQPIYTVADAARLVGMRADRVRRWLRGYEYRYAPEKGRATRRVQRPVVQRNNDSPFASFLDVVELLFVKRFLDSGVSLQKVRRALDEAKSLVEADHPFARQRFFTDGSNVYLAIERSDRDADALLQLLSGGQWTIAPVILEFARRVDFDEATGFATKWWPLGREHGVVIDPTIAFGAPSVESAGIKTGNVMDLYLAEDRDVDAVVSWLQLTPSQVQDAVRFEEYLHKAA